MGPAELLVNVGKTGDEVLNAISTASTLFVPQGVKHREGTVGRQDVQNRHRPDAWIGAREGVRRT